MDAPFERRKIEALEQKLTQFRLELEQKTIELAEKNLEIGQLREEQTAKRVLEAKLQSVELLKETLESDLNRTRSGQDGLVRGLKQRHEMELAQVGGQNKHGLLRLYCRSIWEGIFVNV